MLPQKFSPPLQEKIDYYKSLAQRISLGPLSIPSRLIFAPMAGITTPAMRALMEQLGAGLCVSELVSCDGLNYKNLKTQKMLEIWPIEENVGLQIFGGEEKTMALGAQYALEKAPKFIDINMGCPVRKVVTKGGGSALLQRPEDLYEYFSTIKQAMSHTPTPLTIKIRTGWTQSTRNAPQILRIAEESGIAWVAIHGRTREQQYTGLADWDYMEELTTQTRLDLIGNGDLVHPKSIHERLKSTPLKALMIGRGALRNPFIFLESLAPEASLDPRYEFTGQDYVEVLERYYQYLQRYNSQQGTSVNLKKIAVWFSSGFPHASSFRNKVYEQTGPGEEGNIQVLNLCREFFTPIRQGDKHISQENAQQFMAGGHG